MRLGAASEISDHAKNFLLIALTCAAGSMDALSLLGLQGTFVSALTGNTVLLGVSLVQGQFVEAALRAFVFVGYIPGAALAAFLLRNEKRDAFVWSRRVTDILMIEVVLLFGLLVGFAFNHNNTSVDADVAALIFLSAFCMGIQYMCAKQVNRSGVASTIVATPIMVFVSRLINPVELRRFDETTIFLAAVWGTYFVGAVASAVAVVFVSRILAEAIPLGLVLFVVAYAGIIGGKKRL